MGPRVSWIALVFLVLMAPFPGAAHAQSQPDGQLTIAFDASIAPAFLDPAETQGLGISAHGDAPRIFSTACRKRKCR